ncbi:MAG: conjugative transfer signal peptidase TraF [Sedimenticola sp.]
MRTLTRVVLFVALLLITMLTAFQIFRVHLNTTTSYPRGLWIEDDALDDGIGRRRPFVLACAPGEELRDFYIERGYLPWGIRCGGTIALLKRVFASAGDTWVVTDGGVLVNGVVIQNTAPKRTDSAGRRLPKISGGIVPDNHVLLLSDYSPRSFDGRYFGTTPVMDLISEVKPLWTESH